MKNIKTRLKRFEKMQKAKNYLLHKVIRMSPS